MPNLPQHGWYKSSHSNDFDNACVEVARQHQGVHVRDSKDPDGVRVTVGASAWDGFLSAVKDRTEAEPHGCQ
ncbi:uncharacterized protein DUF397 [Streptomyces sp. 2321.6]|uniref:DUF397 domain-containing protein n=1 Tax=Streptomyces sp. 2321.6 TaxID=1938840 RepID=UPI000BB0F1CA|nr:DUF397 domain-containing protein [Streptomyces sp. 2321.6]PBC72363.1 uncharacterized protein DUF397 [Streptomyces sp. 2321.6]PBC72424.1 uncharacterized protein DUF397 [Streptomyces sp. 2321.6]